MDARRGLLEDLKRHDLAHGHTLGLFHVLIGRRVEKVDGTPISSGHTWRELAELLQKGRWPKDTVRELGLDPAKLPPRDRQHFWYAAISVAQVDSETARRAGDELVALLEPLGYRAK